MRRLIKPARLGSTAIETLKINPKSRDDIENVLRGLQHLYVNRWSDLQRIFDEEFFADVDWHNGRPGTACQPILVIGVLKQGINCDFDRLQSLVDNHALIRAMLGHDDVFDCGGYEMQTLVDNVSLLTPRMLARVGKLLAASGHEVAGKKPGAALRGRVDSFCVETDVHFPTDVNLLMDAVRCMVRETAREACRRGVPGQRQSAHLQAGLRRRFHGVRTRRRQTEKAVREYLRFCRRLVAKTAETFSALAAAGASALKLCLIDSYLAHARRQIDQVSRRLLQGEVIPQNEKVFSIFEPHTRWIAKGKAGSPVEPVVPVVVVEDQGWFIIHHEIMWEDSDVHHAVPVVAAAQERFPELRACSFDRGFHSPENRRGLDAMLDLNALPKKGYLSKAERERQSEPGFAEARRQHPAVESAINHLEHRGLDRIRSHGRDGFARTAALAALAANCCRLGRLLLKRRQMRSRKRLRRRAA